MKAIKLTNSNGTMLVNVATIQKVYTDLDKRSIDRNGTLFYSRRNNRRSF